jgi:two-component system, OmpR family, phosphate regulon sensor histidine kinase PhoR
MAKKRILWQLFLSYLLITFTALLAVVGYASSSLRDFYYVLSSEDLIARAWLVERQVVRKSSLFNFAFINPLTRNLGAKKTPALQSSTFREKF